MDDWLQKGCAMFPVGWTRNIHTCFQLMEASTFDLMQEWVSRWNDIVDFDVHPVVSSDEAAERMSARI